MVDKMSAGDAWVSVSWMPHTSLSQTSHVCLAVRSAHVSWTESATKVKDEEWKIQATVHGIGGLNLADASSQSPTASVRPRSRRTPLKAQQQAIPSSSSTISNTAKHDNEEDHHQQQQPTVTKATHDCVWDYVIHLPLRWQDLPRDAYLDFKVADATHDDRILFQAILPLFTAHGRLHTGLQRAELDAYPSSSDENQNPGLYPPQRRPDHLSEWVRDEEDPVWKASRILHQLEVLSQTTAQTSSVAPTVPSATNTPAATPPPSRPTNPNLPAFGSVPSIPWLNAITKEHCQLVIEGEKQETELLLDDGSNRSYLIVELPMFEIPIMHEESFYPLPQNGACGEVSPFDFCYNNPNRWVPFLDYENELDNPVEDKYRTLAHDLLRGLVDPALKPDREQRDRLAAIIASPSHHPSREDKDLLWRFRFSLVDNRRALTKFLLAVDWTVESEVVQAAELLEQWRKRSPIEVTDALKLLGKHVAFQTNLVRAYAIDTLAAAPDDELRLYLLQLVQALKYESKMGPLDPNSPSSLSSSGSPSSLATFLIDRAARNIELANYLYWYLKVEILDPNHGSRYREVFAALQDRLSATPLNSKIRTTSSASDSLSASVSTTLSLKRSLVDSVSKLGSSLRGTEPITTSGVDASTKKSNGPKSVWDLLLAEDRFISGVMDIQMRSRDARGKRDAKEAHLRAALATEGYDRCTRREPVPLPTAPHIMVNGVNPQTAKVFKSALYPALIEFHVESMSEHHEDFIGKAGSVLLEKTSGSPSHAPRSSNHVSSYKVIVKTGDDLRQDQLIIMMIQLMDGLLKRAALDLCLTPYSIIAMSPTSGLVEFVDGSVPISQILGKHNNSILNFFQAFAPQAGAKYNVRPDVISTYVRSCAGYCVITYLLGVGDRHLDNILLQPSGHFFHIDFGFIFGRDPKPLPPAFRLTREMVEGMGGVDSVEYRQFCSLACQSFNVLRKSAGLVLNLLHLMSDAGIEDLSNNPSADAEGIIAKVEERFRLELTDEQAERYFVALISDCLAAIAPRVMDVFHSLAVARR